MTFDVTILGCGAATPTLQHNPSAQVINVHDKLFLVDCGEGTQMQMRKYGIRFQKINHVFISHLHGDHYLGLLGYMLSMHLLGRSADLHIYGPADLRQIIDLNLQLSQSYLGYTYQFHALNFETKELIFEDNSLAVSSFPLKHRIDCCGFLFDEKNRQPKVKKEIIEAHSLTPSQILLLKKGEDIELPTGQKITVAESCVKLVAPRSYAYCSDTMYWETLDQFISQPTLLYHEATFLENEKPRAKATFHSTASDAAKIASRVKAKRLLLGHFSSRYRELAMFSKEALQYFPDVLLADEGMVIKVE